MPALGSTLVFLPDGAGGVSAFAGSVALVRALPSAAAVFSCENGARVWCPSFVGSMPALGSTLVFLTDDAGGVNAFADSVPLMWTLPSMMVGVSDGMMSLLLAGQRVGSVTAHRRGS